MIISNSVLYLQLSPNTDPPDLPSSPAMRAVVIIDADVAPDWQRFVSQWLVRSGCLYMLAWGPGCSSWDDSVDFASIERHGFQAIPDDESVMTTWHENDPLEDVFHFAKSCASHPTVPLDRTVLLHISTTPREHEMLARYASVLPDGE
ncbi:MAG: hypothetical protein ABI411_17105 [Tahibacter sp.]